MEIFLPHSRLIISFFAFLSPYRNKISIPAYVREGLYGATVKEFFLEKITLSTDLCGINCRFSVLLCLFFYKTVVKVRANSQWINLEALKS